MDPMTAWGVLGGLVTLIGAILGYRKYLRGKRENLAQAEADDLARSIKRADDRVDPALSGLRVDERDAP